MATPTLGRSSFAKANIIVSQGADNVYQFRYSTTEGNVTTPVDLTGYTARAQIRNKVGGTIWASLTTEDNDIVLDEDGYITISLAHATTEDEDWNSRKAGVWDLELVSPGGMVTRFVEGTVLVSPDVTRDDA